MQFKEWVPVGWLPKAGGQVLEAQEQGSILSTRARARVGVSTLASGSLSLSAHVGVEVTPEMKRKQSVEFVSSCGFRQHFLYQIKRAHQLPASITEK